MKNNKIALLPGLSLFLCFCLLTGSGALFERFGGHSFLIALAELLSFLLPFALAVSSMRDQKILRRRLQYRQMPKGVVGFAVKAGLTVALVSLLLNLLVYQLAGLVGADLSAIALEAPQGDMSAAARLLVVVLLSAVVEEFYLRGALLIVHEGIAGTAACLVCSGLVFALLHGSLLNFAGPLFGGIVYAYLAYSFDSVWPAVLAHAVANLYYMLASWVTATYAAFGIWNYFTALNGLLLLLLLYLTLRSMGRLLLADRIPHFEKGAGGYDLWLLVRNPGMVVFVLAFFAKLVIDWFM